MSGTIRESPADFRNGDLISRLLAATPPYQTNSTFVPPGLYFSEMLKRFVQAKSCPPLSANKRGRKRIWKDGGGKAAGEQLQPSEAKHKKTAGADFSGQPPAAPQTEPQLQFPPLWYPPFYPAAYPPPPPLPTPVYFETPETEPLNLRTGRSPPDPVLKPDRHYSAFRVPEPSSTKTEREQQERIGDNKRGTNYLMGHLTQIYRQVVPPASSATDEEKIIDVEGNDDGPETNKAGPDEQQTEKKDCKDLTALIGLELVVDYVKHGNGKDGRNEPNVKCCRNL